MQLLGIDFSAAELVLLAVLAIVVLCLLVVLRRLRPFKGKSVQEDPIAKQTASGALDDTELVAVLTAAAAAYMGTENIKITSYTQTQNKAERPRWAKAGRTEQFSRG